MGAVTSDNGVATVSQASSSMCCVCATLTGA